MCHRRVPSRGRAVMRCNNTSFQLGEVSKHSDPPPTPSLKSYYELCVSRKSQRKEQDRVLARLDWKCVFMASTVLEFCQGALCSGRGICLGVVSHDG